MFKEIWLITSLTDCRMVVFAALYFSAMTSATVFAPKKSVFQLWELQTDDKRKMQNFIKKVTRRENANSIS